MSLIEAGWLAKWLARANQVANMAAWQQDLRYLKDIRGPLKGYGKGGWKGYGKGGWRVQAWHPY